jgi:hypothetical protein
MFMKGKKIALDEPFPILKYKFRICFSDSLNEVTQEKALAGRSARHCYKEAEGSYPIALLSCYNNARMLWPSCSVRTLTKVEGRSQS